MLRLAVAVLEANLPQSRLKAWQIIIIMSNMGAYKVSFAGLYVVFSRVRDMAVSRTFKQIGSDMARLAIVRSGAVIRTYMRHLQHARAPDRHPSPPANLVLSLNLCLTFC